MPDNELHQPFGGLPTWAAIALLSHLSGCVKVAGPNAATAQRLAPEAAPWPGVILLEKPPPPVDCTEMHNPSLSWEQAADGSFRLAHARPWARNPDSASAAPAPVVAAIPELQSGDYSVSTIASGGGWLVAIDRGEFDGGLYSVRAGDPVAQRLDGVLWEPVRRITKVDFGIVGVAGLCHGDAALNRTTAYQVTQSEESGWQLRTLAFLPGCPDASATVGDSLFIASAGLYRIGKTGATRVATWPEHLPAYQLLINSRGDTYYVSFGGVAARFTASATEWFAPRDCPHLEREPGSILCRCPLGPLPHAASPPVSSTRTRRRQE